MDIKLNEKKLNPNSVDLAFLGKKSNGDSAIANPRVKEMKPLFIYGGVIIAIALASYTLIGSESGTYSYDSYTNNKLQIQNDSTQLKTLSSKVGEQQGTISALQKSIDEQKKLLEEANLVRSNLGENFSFLGYFDELVNANKLKVNNITVVTVDPATKQPIPDGIGNIDIDIEGTYKDTVGMFEALYVKRVIYISNLKITNNLDGTVNSKFTISFRKDNPNEAQVNQKGGQPANQANQTNSAAGAKPTGSSATGGVKPSGATNTAGSSTANPAGASTGGTPAGGTNGTTQTQTTNSITTQGVKK